LLLLIGGADLVSTALLHSNGLITEMNPIMRPVIETSEWLFVLIKGMTLVAAWLVMLKYRKTHLKFIERVCYAGSFVYVMLWIAWFSSGL
jgi:hypothetical protein